MWELDYNESWVPKTCCFWTVVLEKTFESPLDYKKIQPVHPKGNQSWIFTGRTEAQTPILWPRVAKNWLTGKAPDAGKDWRWEEKVRTEDEMVGWQHRLDGREFGHALGVGDGQGSPACCIPWGGKELDTTEQLNWTKLSVLGTALQAVTHYFIFSSQQPYEITIVILVLQIRKLFFTITKRLF